MTAIEHLLLRELKLIWTIENRLQRTYAALKNATDDQVAQFRHSVADLDDRANRLERRLNELVICEQVAS